MDHQALRSSQRLAARLTAADEIDEQGYVQSLSDEFKCETSLCVCARACIFSFCSLRPNHLKPKKNRRPAAKRITVRPPVRANPNARLPFGFWEHRGANLKTEIHG